MQRLFIGALLALVSCVSLAGEAPIEKWSRSPGNCPRGLHVAPQGPFAVVLLCEDALGEYLSVLWYAPMGQPATASGRWSLKNRYWHDPIWGADVTGFKWSKNGNELLVSTSSVYGSGALFALDLHAHTYKQLLPEDNKVSLSNPGPGYNIAGEHFDKH
jgi:hypothetical protein